MRCRMREDGSSLELLLDTITNTFGGVLFLAILVSLLLRTTAPSASQSRSAEPAMSPAEQAAYEVRLDDLRDQLSRLQRNSAPKPLLTPSNCGADEADFRRLNAELASLLQEEAAFGLQCATHQRERQAAIDETARLAEKRVQAAEHLVSAQQEMVVATQDSARLSRIRLSLEQHQQPNTIEQTVGLPTLRPNPKRQVGLFLKFNKVYMMHTWRNGVRLGPNPEHFIVTDGRPPAARAKPNAGIRVRDDTIAQDVRRLLSAFPPDEWVVAIVACEDSFASYQVVKRAIVDAGYDYRPMAVARGEGIVDSGGDSEAQ